MAESNTGKDTTSAKAESTAKAQGKADAADAAPDVDPRLDNRVGEQRPYGNGMKPQQVYGGQPGDDSDDEDPRSADAPDDAFIGHQSVGPHGRGPAVGRAPGAVADGED